MMNGNWIFYQCLFCFVLYPSFGFSQGPVGDWSEISLPIRSSLLDVKVRSASGEQTTSVIAEVPAGPQALGKEVFLFEEDHTALESAQGVSLSGFLNEAVHSSESLDLNLLKMNRWVACDPRRSMKRCRIRLVLVGFDYPGDDLHRMSLADQTKPSIEVSGFVERVERRVSSLFVVKGFSEGKRIRLRSISFDFTTLNDLAARMNDLYPSYRNAFSQMKKENAGSSNLETEVKYDELAELFRERFFEFSPEASASDLEQTEDSLRSPASLQIPLNTNSKEKDSRFEMLVLELAEADAARASIQKVEFRLANQQSPVKSQSLALASWVIETTASEQESIVSAYIHYAADRGYLEFDCPFPQSRIKTAVGRFSNDRQTFLLAAEREESLSFFEWKVPEKTSPGFFDYIFWNPPRIGRLTFEDVQTLTMKH